MISIVLPLQLRRGTAAQWVTANTLLSAGECGFETDTYKLKIGNGSTSWNSLAYFSPSLDYVGPYPAAPTGLSGTTTGTSITWTWTAPAGIPQPDGYVLWISTTSSFSSGVTIVDHAGNTTPSYTQTGISLGVTYYCVVSAIYNKSAGVFSSSSSALAVLHLFYTPLVARLDRKYFARPAMYNYRIIKPLKSYIEPLNFQYMVARLDKRYFARPTIYNKTIAMPVRQVIEPLPKQIITGRLDYRYFNKI